MCPDDDDIVNGGWYDPNVTIVADSEIVVQSYYWPDGNGTGGGLGGDGSSGDNIPASPTFPQVAPLHPDIVNNLFTKIVAVSNLTQTQKNVFKQFLSDLDSTAIGDRMLTNLNAKINLDSIVPIVTDEVPTDGSTCEYDPNTHKLKLGDLLDGTHIQSYVDFNASHELYHCYQQNFSQDSTKSNFEMDGYIFAAKITQTLYPDDDFVTQLILHYEVSDPFTDAQIAFKNAWEKLINGDMTSANYAILVNNFIDGSSVGDAYRIHNGVNVTPSPTSLPFFINTNNHQPFN